MRAVIRRSGSLVCDEISDPEPGPGQTLVRTLFCGICGSDLHALHFLDHMVDMTHRAGGGRALDPTADVVFGHEFSAEVLDHGPGGGRFKAGTHVVSMPLSFGPLGFETIGYSNRFPGGFAQQMILTEAMLLEVPNGLPAATAALTEPFAVGAHAVASATLEPNSVCLVLGCGPVGLAVIANLKLKGHGPVIAADFSPKRRATAERLGADIIIDPQTMSPHAQWEAFGVPAGLASHSAAVFSGKSVAKAVIFECVGTPGMLQSIIEGCPPKAQIIIAGVCMESDRIEPSLAINKQLDLRFVLGYTPEEFAATLLHIAEGRIAAEAIITDIVRLDDVALAFAALGDPESQVKVLVEPARA